MGWRQDREKSGDFWGGSPHLGALPQSSGARRWMLSPGSSEAVRSTEKSDGTNPFSREPCSSTRSTTSHAYSPGQEAPADVSDACRTTSIDTLLPAGEQRQVVFRGGSLP